MISEEKLMAYLDGDVSAKERAQIEAAVSQNDGLRKLLAEEQAVRRGIALHYDPILDEKVPERLTRLVTGLERASSQLRKPRFSISAIWSHRSHWLNAAALAASLALGIFFGIGMNVTGEATVGGPGTGLEKDVALALQTQLSSTQMPDDPVRIGITFAGPDGEMCRTFENSSSVGLACYSQDVWQLRLLAPEAAGANTRYRQANSSSALVMRSVQEMIVGEPLDARQERQARDAGWAGKE